MAGQAFVLPRKKTGFGEFVEAFQPGLDRAFQLYLQNKMSERQKGKGWEDLVKAGYAKKETSPEGQSYALKQMGITNPMDAQQVAQAQQGIIPKVNIPSQYQNYILNKENIPAGMTVDVPGSPFKYTAPQPQQNLFSNLTIDQEGNPAIKIGEKVIPIKSLSKTGFSIDTPQEIKITASDINALKPDWWQNLVGGEQKETYKKAKKKLSEQMGIDKDPLGLR